MCHRKLKKESKKISEFAKGPPVKLNVSCVRTVVKSDFFITTRMICVCSLANTANASSIPTASNVTNASARPQNHKRQRKPSMPEETG